MNLWTRCSNALGGTYGEDFLEIDSSHEISSIVSPHPSLPKEGKEADGRKRGKRKENVVDGKSKCFAKKFVKVACS